MLCIRERGVKDLLVLQGRRERKLLVREARGPLRESVHLPFLAGHDKHKQMLQYHGESMYH